MFTVSATDGPVTHILSYVPQEAMLAAEELAWDKKMSALRQPANKGPSSGSIPVEQTEDDPEVLCDSVP